MSVAPLTAQELGCFVAICHKHLKAGAIDTLCKLAAAASCGNAGAYSAQYGEPLDPCQLDEIEHAAREYLDGVRDEVDDRWGPVAYNMVANDGTPYLAPGLEAPTQAAIFQMLEILEDRARKWQDAARHAAQRAEQNAAAFDDVGQCRVLSQSEIMDKLRAAGAERVIVARYCVDESDSQSDYFGGRTARTVVIGFGKGKRENFRQLRAAAGKFPPTAHMGPGRDMHEPRVVLLDDVISNGSAYWQGTGSHWHREMEDDAVFATQAEAVAYTVAQGDPEPIQFDGKLVHFGWKIYSSSYEQRENYSMGGGNYLGSSRYGGWKVSSCSGGALDRCEYWEPR